MPQLRETSRGNFFEDFVVGDVFRCRLGRTITEADNIQFTLLTNNSNQVHFNRVYGERTPWGKCLVNSLLTLAIVVGMGTADISENGIALGWDDVRLPHPVFAGDTLFSESEVVTVRASARRPQQGIVTVEGRGYTQTGTLVVAYRRSVLVWKRAFAPSIDLFPVPATEGSVD